MIISSLKIDVYHGPHRLESQIFSNNEKKEKYNGNMQFIELGKKMTLLIYK